MDPRDLDLFGGRGGGRYRGRGGRSDRGGRGGGPHHPGDGSRGSGVNQGTNPGTPGVEILATREYMLEAFPEMLQTMPAGARLRLFIDTGAPSTAASATPRGNKRNLTDEGDHTSAPKPKKQKKGAKDPEIIDPNLCGNCGAQNHKAAFCVKIGQSGWMEACPKCDSTRHLYEACPHRNKGEEDFIYLVYNRQRKPPVKSTMKLGKVVKTELARDGTKWHGSQVIELPYSPLFARQEARKNPPEAWTYENVGDPTEEAKGRTPEPTRTDLTLKNAAEHINLAHQAWSKEQETFDPTQDGEMPTMRTLVDSRRDSRLMRRVTRLVCRTRPADDLLRNSAPDAAERIKAAHWSSPCRNCGQLSHLIYDCPGRCAACGGRDHKIHNCRQQTQACVCEETPFHLLKDCKKHCEYCVIVGNNNDPHYAKDCAALCHYCLERGHKMGDCPKDKSVGRYCITCTSYGIRKRRFHLPSQCPYEWCYHTDCEGRLECEIHCKKCGWHRDEVELVKKAGRHHVCQFIKSWDYTTQVPTIQLHCLRNNHKLKHSDLVDLHTIVLEETKVLHEIDWEIEPWINECPECRADMAKTTKE